MVNFHGYLPPRSPWLFLSSCFWLVSVLAFSKTKKSEVDPASILKIILTTQGGNGHLQAANRIRQDFTKEGIPHKLVDIVDEHYMSSLVNIGWVGALSWNHLNRKGRVRDLQFLADHQWLAESWYGERFFRKVVRLLTKYPNVNEIVDTQPLNTDQIARAVYLYNEIPLDQNLDSMLDGHLGKRFKHLFHLNKPQARARVGAVRERPIVGYRKILTDLPTEKAEHFLGSIKKVDPQHVKYLTVETVGYPKDNAVDGETQAFFRRVAPHLFQIPGYSPIRVTLGPIRHGFLEFIKQRASKDEPLAIKVTDEAEYNDLMTVLGTDKSEHPLHNNRFPLVIGEASEVHSIMLGSQVNAKGVIGYLEHEMELYRELAAANKKVFVFVFTGQNDHKNSLFHRLLTLIDTSTASSRLLPGLTIVPLSFQDDSMIARLYSLADRIIVRSGGLSSMEVEAVSRGFVFIHSAYEKEEEDLSHPLVRRGMPSWEGGNALHVLNRLRNPDGSRRSYIINTQLYPKVIRMLAKRGKI